MLNVSIVITGVVSGYLVTKLCQPYIIIQTHQESMLPSIADGNLFIGINANHAKCRINKRDVVVFATPQKIRGNELAVKRIINLPSESISYYSRNRGELVQLTVPDDHFWLLGDNARVSIDSRNYGPVPFDKIKYKLLFRFWPLWSAGFVCSDSPPRDESD